MARWVAAVFVSFLCTTRFGGPSAAGQSAVGVTDNGYTNVAVAIRPDVPYSDQLVAEIKGAFSEASIHLYRASRRRLFFRNVTILVPSSWPGDPAYLTRSPARLDRADVVVEASGGRGLSLPYTRQHMGCGHGGLDINVMADLLLGPTIGRVNISLGRLLVHEWGHYRWGLFDEHPEDIDDQFYYSSLTNRFEGTRCSFNITGTPLIWTDDDTARRDCVGNSSVGYEVGCTYTPSSTQQLATGSLMFGRGNYDTITDFCDSVPDNSTSLHNHEAPNRQNRLCDRRSNWEVMREHPDLRDGNNPPREIAASDLQPSFQVVRPGLRRIVVVLETSRQMELEANGNPFRRMIAATAAYISWAVPDGVSLGIVGYQDTATNLSDLVNIQSDADRRRLLATLPTSCSGLTSVGYALYEAIQLLQKHDSPTVGDHVLLINGFKGDQFPNIDYGEKLAMDANVIVDTVAMTSQADPQLSELSRKTGGKFFFASGDSGTADSLIEAFKGTIDSDNNLQIWSKTWSLSPGESHRGTVYLDATVGVDTKFTVLWLQEVSSAPPSVTLVDPGGSTLTTSYPGYENNTALGVIAYRLDGIAQEGTWTIVLENTDPIRPADTQLSVTSAPRGADVPPISVTSSVSELTKDFAAAEVPLVIFADVRQGYRQVTNANVTALVSIPTLSNTVEVQLVDTGTGADVTRNDGVYSGYCTNYTVDGFYGVQISAQNDGDATVVDFPSECYSLDGAGNGMKAKDVFESTSQRRNRRDDKWSPAPIFRRVVSAGGCRVVNAPVPGTDAFPPGKITDLKVVSASFTDQAITLAWTATGDDYDSGKASFYTVTRGPDVEAVLANAGTVTVQQSDVIQGDLSDPKTAGSPEVFVIAVPVDSSDVSSFAVTVVAVDAAGLASPLSNIELAAVRRYVPGTGAPTATPGATGKETTDGRPNATATTAAGEATRSLTRGELIAIVILSSMGFVTALTIVLASITKCLKATEVAPSSRTASLVVGKQSGLNTLLVVDLEMQGLESEV